MVRRVWLFGNMVAMLLASPSPVFAAAGTTCLCRTPDGKSFTERVLRHSRWACDYLLGYARGAHSGDKDGSPASRRPTNETCNGEEVIQFKVHLCVSSGCTYPYAVSVPAPNSALRKIETINGKRRP